MEELTVSQVQFYGEGLLRWMQSGEMSLEDMTSGGKSLQAVSPSLWQPIKRGCRFGFQRHVF